MLTSIDYFEKGQLFPPQENDTLERLARYSVNTQLFDGKQAKIYQMMLNEMERKIVGFRRDIIDYPVILNYQKLISFKTADLLFMEEPLIAINEQDKELVQQISDNSGADDNLMDVMYMGCIDASRYGDSVYHIYRDENQNPKCTIVNPKYWFPIVNVGNIHSIKNHVIAYMTCTNPQAQENNRNYQLNVQIHYKGYYEEKVYNLKKETQGNKIGDLVSNKRVTTGLKDFAIVTASNQMTSNKATGIDDYKDINQLINEIMVRLSQISKILDKHASPGMQGPDSALTENQDGEWVIEGGDYFARNSKDDPDISYITWDGKLESAFNEVTLLLNQLYIMSEMSPALLGDLTESGRADSGTALRLRMIPPLAKAKRLKKSFDKAIKQIYVLEGQLYNTSIERTDVSITWMDGLPTDPVEEANIMQIRTNGKPTMSQERALKTYDEMEQDEIEEEMVLIKENEMGLNDFLTMGNNEPAEEEQDMEEGGEDGEV